MRIHADGTAEELTTNDPSLVDTVIHERREELRMLGAMGPLGARPALADPSAVPPGGAAVST